MTTLPEPPTNYFPEDSLEKKVYNMVEEFKEYIPIDNQRYRLAFGLVKYLQGEGDAPEILAKSNKLKLEGITRKELGEKLSARVKEIK